VRQSPITISINGAEYIELAKWCREKGVTMPASSNVWPPVRVGMVAMILKTIQWGWILTYRGCEAGFDGEFTE
jgi:hypothetical protein